MLTFILRNVKVIKLTLTFLRSGLRNAINFCEYLEKKNIIVKFPKLYKFIEQNIKNVQTLLLIETDATSHDLTDTKNEIIGYFYEKMQS